MPTTVRSKRDNSTMRARARTVGVDRAVARAVGRGRSRGRARAPSRVVRAADVELLPWARELDARDDDFRRDENARATTSARAATLFGTKLFAWVYWRGYRQMFNALGYPGVEKEVELALRNFPTEATSALDVSCGPGVITDALARSGRFQSVVAIDYSDEMVVAAREECGSRAKIYVADVCDLPFASDSFDAVHSSAGAHCWGEPSTGFKEMYRVLKPGGTILISTVVLLKKKTDEETYMQNRLANTPFWDETTVVKMMQDSEFVGVEVVSMEKCFVSIRARKN